MQQAPSAPIDARRCLRSAWIAFGGNYNPEQWPEEVWAEDVALMKEAGVSMVTAGIFSWAKVEPRPGEYDFGWFDRVMDHLAGAGVAVCLATMTAAPPPWLSRLHPEILPETADGRRMWPVGRQHYCPSSPVYRRYATRLAERLATRYADHGALEMWHIGNEYGCHAPQCWCDKSAADFRRRLSDRYGDIDSFGEGDAWYVATRLGHEAMRALVDDVCRTASVGPVLDDRRPDPRGDRRRPHHAARSRGGRTDRAVDSHRATETVTQGT